MSDVEGRADDYERRLEHAGGTDPLMAGLAEAVNRNRRITRIFGAMLVGAVLLVCVLAWYAINQQQAQDVITKKVSDNTKQVAAAVHEGCANSQANAVRLNTLQRRLRAIEIQALHDPTQPHSLDQLHHDRIRTYTAGIIPLVKCP